MTDYQQLIMPHLKRYDFDAALGELWNLADAAPESAEAREDVLLEIQFIADAALIIRHMNYGSHFRHETAYESARKAAHLVLVDQPDCVISCSTLLASALYCGEKSDVHESMETVKLLRMNLPEAEDKDHRDLIDGFLYKYTLSCLVCDDPHGAEKAYSLISKSFAFISLLSPLHRFGVEPPGYLKAAE